MLTSMITLWTEFLVGTGQFRVLRGGSWNFNATNARSAGRVTGKPADRYVSYGFRVVAVVRTK